MTRFLSAFIAACAFAGPLAAQPPATAPAAAPARTLIEVPFSPPLDRPVFYRHSKRTVDRRGDVTVTTNIRIRFSPRQGGGFRAEVTQLDARMEPADDATAALFQRMFEMYNRPYVMLFDANGALGGIEDETRYWDESMRQAEEVVANLPGASEELRSLSWRVIDTLRAMPVDQRRAMLTEAVSPTFDVAGGSWRLGEPLESDAQRTTAFGAPVTEHQRMLAERIDGTTLFMSRHGTIASADLIAATERFYDMIPLNGRGNNTPEGRAQVLRQLRASEIRHDTEISYEAEIASGLVRRYRSVETNSITMPGTAGSNKVTTITLERTD